MSNCTIWNSNPWGPTSIFYHGQSITVDRDTRFASDKGLPLIDRAISPNGTIFDIYKGIGRSCLGCEMEFAVAVIISNPV